MAKLWLWVDCRIHQNEKINDLAADLGLDADTLVGKLVRLWSWLKTSGSEDGRLGRLPSSEIAAIMRWTKRPDRLVTALVNHGFLSVEDDGGYTVHDWYESNGKSTEKARKDRERKVAERRGM